MIVIPDIHGRTFWRKTVEEHENEKIIFLGDYTDPYPHEGVNYWEGLLALRDVIDFKKRHMDNVVMLLGNHDLSYISDCLPSCRHDDENHDEIKNLIKANLLLFDIAHEEKVGSKRVVFSHAGIHPEWLKENEMLFGGIRSDDVVHTINRMFHKGQLYTALGDVSWQRGGFLDVGSCVWADLEEFMEILPSHLPDCYQIFGHTQSAKPVITEWFACIDCHSAFCLDDNMNLRKL